MKHKYDLHIHSCLSPCADDEMTPGNIATLASLLGLSIVALTYHNTSRNCPAFFSHAKRLGIVPVAGMEMTTSEDIHVICLFDTLEGAMDFDGEVSKRRIRIKNRPDIFGHQYVMNEYDEVCGEEEDLLINATTLDLVSAWELCVSHGGVCYPAHIDRESGGAVAMLGAFPESPEYSAFELNNGEAFASYTERFPELLKKRYVVSSDAHRLESLSDGKNFLEIEDPPDDIGSYSAFIRSRLLEYLKGGGKDG